MAQELTQSPRYCLYARKSSEDDERQALSIDSQITAMLRIAETEQLEIVETIRESKSAKTSWGRVHFEFLIEGLKEGRYDSIITWAPDRLSRNAWDLGKLVDLMDAWALRTIRTHGQNFRNDPNEKFLLMILCSQAKLENDNRSMNVRRGLKTKCEMGVRPGRVPLGYLLVRGKTVHEKSRIELDEDMAPKIRQLFKWIAEDGHSGRQVWEYAYDRGFHTKKGKRITLSMIFRILADEFYTGEFEYPKGSGDRYKGIYPAIIDRETFEKTREKMKVSPKGKWGRKDFPFAKLLVCGECGSCICWDEKANRHGGTYVYYRCTQYWGKGSCSQKMVREERIIDSLVTLAEETSVISPLFRSKIKREMERFENMERMFRRNVNQDEEMPHLRIKDYLKYALSFWSARERSEVLRSLGEKFSLAGNVLGKVH